MNHDQEPRKGPYPEFVLMPWDDDKTNDANTENGMTRWGYIKRQLEQSNQITTITELIELIRSYDISKEGSGKQSQSPRKFLALLQCFDELTKTEKNEFFKENGILGTITNLALQGPEMVSQVKLLVSGHSSSVTLHQLQIASILANAFMCTFPKRDLNYPSINFHMLFEGPDRGNIKPYIEKIKCIIHYFRRINEKQPTGNLSFHRLCITDHKLPRWDKTTAKLSGLKVEIQGKIEDQEGFLQMDFANRFVGGGVLGKGCVQEEIRFIICPELIASRLFTQCLADNEALLIAGAERYCKYTGFSDSFRFDGDYRDATPLDDTSHRKTYLIVLDALYFSHSSEQYRESKILRELKKAYVGFKPFGKSCSLPLATGNWGCGTFRGDPQLKSILQLMASSQARRDVLYLTFGDSNLKKQIDDLYKLLKEREINVGTLYRIIRLYNRNKNKNQTLFDFIRDMILNYKKRTCEGKPSADFEASNETDGSPSHKISRQSGTHYANIEKRIGMCSISGRDPDSGERAETRETEYATGETGADGKPRDWVFDFGDSNASDHPRSSPCEDVEMLEEPTPGPFETPKDENKKDAAQSERPKTGVGSSVESKPKKLIQPLITDCFPKK